MKHHRITPHFTLYAKTLIYSSTNGFTLIELLVAILIIGVLSAIALPGFLSQAAKARGSEAKAALGTINRAQQAYHLQSGSFTGQFSDLEAKISPKFYSYQLTLTDNQNASATATANQLDLKSYSAAVTQNNDYFGQAICESLDINTPAGTATAPNAAGQNGSCAATGRLIQ